MGFYAYQLDEATREGLLTDIPPKYATTFANHITYKTGKEGESMPELDKAEIIGVADDGKGLQTAIVRINGSVERPDGKIYNIPWSANSTATPDSNGLAGEVMDKNGAAKSSAKATLDMFDKPHRLGGDAVYIGDNKSVTPVRLHGATPAGMQAGSISRSITPEAQTQRTL
jgi:hypothetical protein